MASKARLWPFILTMVVFAAGASASQAQSSTDTTAQSPAPAFTVDARIALTSLMSLSDNHLQKLADSLETLAATPEARSGDWGKIKGPLGELAKFNVPALLWFALPDGSFWSVQEGQATGNLSDRAYFSRVLAGKKVIGDLVVGRATGKSSGIVAVPVFRPDGSVAGVLGGSVYLEQLSALIQKETQIGGNLIFFSTDAQPLLALVYDPSLILVEPFKLGDEVKNAFTEILSRDQGVVTYTFREQRRTVIYQKSPVTNWWYALGLVHSN